MDVGMNVEQVSKFGSPATQLQKRILRSLQTIFCETTQILRKFDLCCSSGPDEEQHYP